MPDRIKFSSEKFVRQHDKMVVDYINTFYEDEYDKFMKFYKEADEVNDKIKSFRRDIEELEEDLEQAVSKGKKEKQAEIKDELSMLKMYTSIFQDTQKMLIASMEEITNPRIETVEVHNLQVVNNTQLKGSFTFEGFLSPKPETEIKIPMRGIQFHLLENSIIYFCVNFDKHDIEKNYVSVRFLKSNRRRPRDFEDYVKDPYSYFAKLKDYMFPPKVSIDPSNVSGRGIEDAIDPISTILAYIAPLKFIGGLLDRAARAVDGAFDEFIMDNMGVGVKSFTMSHKRLRLHFGAKTLLGTIKINNIYEHKIEDNYVDILGRFTLNQEQHFVQLEP